jgi:phosphoserine aminotransferase
MKPDKKPIRPTFASGPCSKFPGWSFSELHNAALSRSHRSQLGQERINSVLKLTKDVLEIPSDYHLALVPGSATGAMEMAIWNLAGALPLQVIIDDVFSDRWASDIINQLKLKNTLIYKSDHGKLSDLTKINPEHDVLLNWNGSTSGVKIPNGEWISADRQGLVLVDATSAAFTTDLPWSKLDAVAFSWQKGLGGEAGHGMLALSPRAVDRIKTYQTPWPIPFLFTVKRNGQFYADLFDGKTLNTPSLLCLEDFFRALTWAQRIGGLRALLARTQTNFAIIDQWVAKSDWVDFLAEDPSTRSTSSICLKVVDPQICEREESQQWEFLKEVAALLATEQVAFDILNHTSAPPSIRIWGGPTNEADDIKALLLWLDWCFKQTLASDRA